MNRQSEPLRAEEVEIGLHPDGYRIDRTAAPMNRYTRWTVSPAGEWTDPQPVCFHALPESGWRTASGFDWNNTQGES